MNDEPNRGNAPDVRHPPRGEGLVLRKSCMGCGHWQSTLGSMGVGPKWRCSGCVAHRTAFVLRAMRELMG